MRFDSTLRKAGPQEEKCWKSYGYLATRQRGDEEAGLLSSEQSCTIIRSHTSTTPSPFSSEAMISPCSPCQEARPTHRKKEPDEKNYEILTKKEKKNPAVPSLYPTLSVQCHQRFFAAPICVPCTLLPNRRLLLLSCQCPASGDRCSIMSVRLDLPLAAVPPREDWRR